jgi:hypothetical protein
VTEPTISAAEADPPSLELVLDLMPQRLDEQWQESTILDSKSNFTLTPATLLAAGLASFSKDLVGRKIGDLTSITGLAFVFSVVLYLFLIVAVWQAHRTREFKHSPEPVELMTYVGRPLATTRDEVADAMRYSFQVNHQTICYKARWLRAAEWLLLVEAVWIAAIVSWRVMR